MDQLTIQTLLWAKNNQNTTKKHKEEATITLPRILIEIHQYRMRWWWGGMWGRPGDIESRQIWANKGCWILTIPAGLKAKGRKRPHHELMFQDEKVCWGGAAGLWCLEPQSAHIWWRAGWCIGQRIPRHKDLVLSPKVGAPEGGQAPG
jgi:hypothetical protein